MGQGKNSSGIGWIGIAGRNRAGNDQHGRQATNSENYEDVIVNKFKTILPQIAGNPVQDKLNQYFLHVKKGHDRVLEMRNAFQAS